ncbi:MAG: Rne/Rng family ribonuclease [Humibacillus sp.]
MASNDNTTTTTTSDETSSTLFAAEQDASAPEATSTEGAPKARAPRKRATAKRTTKKAAAPSAVAPPVSDAPPAAGSEPPTAGASAGPSELAEPTDSIESADLGVAASDDASGAEPVLKAAKRAPRKRASRAKTAVPATEVESSESAAPAHRAAAAIDELLAAHAGASTGDGAELPDSTIAEQVPVAVAETPETPAADGGEVTKIDEIATTTDPSADASADSSADEDDSDEDEDDEASAAPVVPSLSLLFQPPAPTRRRRAAVREAGPATPAPAESAAETVTASDAPAQTRSEGEGEAQRTSAPETGRRRSRRASSAVTTPDASAPRDPAEATSSASGAADGDDATSGEDRPAGRGTSEEDDDSTPRRSRRRRGGKGRRGRGGSDDDTTDEVTDGQSSEADAAEGSTDADDTEDADEPDSPSRSTRGRSGRSRSRGSRQARQSDDGGASDDDVAEQADGAADAQDGADPDSDAADGPDDDSASSRRRRRRRRAGSSSDSGDDTPNVSTRVRQPRSASDEPTAVRGSTRLEAKKQRRREGREAGRRRTVITEAEFLARREAVDRVMVVRNRQGRTQMGVLEDNVLVEHYIDQATNVSMAGNIYLGRVQNVLPSMEAAFVDIGKGRNAVLYAGEVNWDAAGLESGQPKRIEHALSSGQAVLVQVTKDPIGHKGARLTSQISLPGRYLVYVPNASMTGISRKLPDTERARLKKILRDVVPDSAGVIVRTAAEGASEEELRADVERLTRTWEEIQAQAEGVTTPKAGKSKGRKKNGGTGSTPSGTAPLLLHGEPDLTVRVIRDVFNEDFKELVVQGEQAWNEIHPYITSVAPDLADRVTKWTSDEDLFTHHRVDEQLAKAMDRKVWLPSGGSLVIDRTEAMTVVDVNTGKFVGSGGNLEETVTKNNIEAAEEIVRQLRLRDIGGIIVVDFIDMVLESNRDLVVRRLLECLGRDRTKHQVAEVTSLGLVQMTRKRVGSGLIEVFSETCENCNGRGFIIHTDPVDRGAHEPEASADPANGRRRGGRGTGSTNGNSPTGNGSTNGNGAPAPAVEQQRPSGPTAAQIAAAAHAAALKTASAGDGHPHTFPDDTGPWAAQDVPVVESSSAPMDAPEPATEAAPEPTPMDAPEPATEAEPMVEPEMVAVPERTSAPEPVIEPEPELDGQPEVVAEVVSDSEVESTVEVTPAPRGRRRRGRVIAPAGPPRAGGPGTEAPHGSDD